jgi:hypothetical protein
MALRQSGCSSTTCEANKSILQKMNETRTKPMLAVRALGFKNKARNYKSLSLIALNKLFPFSV